MAKAPEEARGNKLRTQEDVQKYFCPKMNRAKSVYRKVQTAYIRRAIKGERIVTKVNNVEETTNTVKDQTSWIACGQTGEQYILTADKFEANYEVSSAKQIDPAAVATTGSNMLSELRNEGFQEYQSKRSVFAHKVSTEDIAWLQFDGASASESEDEEDSASVPDQHSRRTVAYFMAPWGESMRVEPGDVLVMPANSTASWSNCCNEVYRIEKVVFSDSYDLIPPDH